MWYGKQEPALGIWSNEIDTVTVLASVLKEAGYSIVLTAHTSDGMRVPPRYQEDYDKWLSTRDAA